MNTLIAKLNQKKLIIVLLYLTCLGMVVLQLYNGVNIFISKPTTASLELVNSNSFPLSFTFCKIFRTKFNGNFSTQTHASLKNISIQHKNSGFDLLNGSEITFEFVSYVEDPLMCKEYELPKMPRNFIKLVREYDSAHKEENNKNLHLYIHQPGMFYLQEFTFKYPSEDFILKPYDQSNENAKIQIESYDISMDPHLSCTQIPYQECVSKQIIMMFNATMGCTYPIQR